MVYCVEDDASIRELALYALTQAGIEAEAISSDGTACYSGGYSLRYPQRHRVQILCE